MRNALYLITLLTITLASGKSLAEQVSVTVTDNSGNPLKQAVLALTASTASGRALAAQQPLRPAELAQRDKQFDPHVVAVQRGSKVGFPNYDDIKHQVYSLSDSKQFDLLVDKGATSVSEQFDVVGAVNIGCNIHDWMLAYVYVVDTPYFGTTDEQGKVSFDIPAGERFNMEIWHPRLDKNEPASKGTVTSSTIPTTIALQQDLLPNYDEDDDIDEFDDY